MKNGIKLILLILMVTILCGYHPLAGQILINEVYPAKNNIELINASVNAISSESLNIVDGQKGDLTLTSRLSFECGDLIMAPGELLLVKYDVDISGDAGQLMVYDKDGKAMSYIQWGGVQSLASTAFSLGVWNDATSFITGGKPDNRSIQLLSVEEPFDVGSYDWVEDNSICVENRICTINTPVISDILCQDNGTPSDPQDDYFSFFLYTDGENLDQDLQLRMVGGEVDPKIYTPGCNTCQYKTNPGTANKEVYQFYLTDPDGGCEETFRITAPESCSDQCSIYAQFIVIDCNDNGTMTDPMDDYMEFVLKAWNTNCSDSYYVDFSYGLTLGPLTYIDNHEATTQGYYHLGGDGFTVTFRDAEDENVNSVIDVQDLDPCSDGCDYSHIDIHNIQCHNNDTPADPNDDYLTFDIESFGNNLSDSYRISSSMTTITPAQGSNFTISSFATAPGSAEMGDIEFRIIDGEDEDCAFDDILVNPGSCSDVCTISIDTLDISCQNNGSKMDGSDDYYRLIIRLSGGSMGLISANIQPFSDQIEILEEDSIYIFTTPEGSADDLAGFGFTFFDANDESCTGLSLHGEFSGPCEEVCHVQIDSIDIRCHDNGSASDPTDDYYVLELQVSSVNASDSFSLSGSPFDIQEAAYANGVLHTFTSPVGSADDFNNFAITILDAQDSTCTGLTLDGITSGPCSDQCEVMGVEIFTKSETDICLPGGSSGLFEVEFENPPQDSFCLFAVDSNNIIQFITKDTFFLPAILEEGDFDIYVYTFSYIEFLEVGGLLSRVEGCFARSNPIPIHIEKVVALNLVPNVDTTLCTGTSDFNIDYEVTSFVLSPNTESVKVLTDTSGNIISYFKEDMITLEGNASEPYMRRLYNLAYRGELLDADHIDISLASGCYHLKEDFITLTVEWNESCTASVKDGIDNGIKIFPNPALDQIILSYPDQIRHTQVTIFNSALQVVEKSTLQKKEQRIDVGDFLPGVYFVIVQDLQNTYQLKFVKL